MDLQELEKWITADEGKKWLEAQKKGLVDKNNELLEKVTSGNAAAVQLNEKAVKLESDLLKANSTIREVLLSKPLAEKLKANGIFETLIPTLAETITKSYGLEIKTNGNDFEVMGKDNGKEQNLNRQRNVLSRKKQKNSLLYLMLKAAARLTLIRNGRQ